MSLVPHKIVALNENNEGTKNTIAGAVVSLFDSSGAAVTLFDDEAGSNGSTTKQTDSQGAVVVWVTAGEYDEEVNGSVRRRVSVGGNSVISYPDTASLQTSRPTKTGQRAENRERANAQYELAPSGVTAKFSDVIAANGRLWEHVINGPVNAREFGLSGGDATSVLQGIADWMDESKEVFFVDDFAITSTVIFSNGGTVDFGNITIDGTGLPSSTSDRTLNQALVFTGSLETAVSISADISAGDSTFTSSGANLSVGDTVIIRSDQPFVDGWGGGVNNRRGEILTISDVSGSTYTVSERFKFGYSSVSNLRVEKMNPTSPKIKGGNLQMGGVGSEHRGLQLIYARNATIEGLTVRGAEDTSVAIEYSHTVNYKGECWDATTPTSGFNTGYGVSSINGSRNIDIDVVGHNCKHVVTAGGFLPSLETRVRGVAYDSGLTTTAFDCHEPCYDWDWDVECYGGNAGIGLRGSDQKVKIKARNLGSNAVRVEALDAAGLQSNIDIEIDSDGTGSTAITLQSGTQPLDNVKIRGTVRNTAINGFSAVGNTTYRISNVQLDLDVDGSDSRAFDVRYADGVAGRVRCRNSGERGFQSLDSTGIYLDVDLTSSASPARNAIYLERVQSAEFSGAGAYSPATAAILTTDCSDISVKVASIEAIGGTSDCWRAVDTIGGKLIGSTLTAGRHGVFSSGTSDNFITSLNDATGVVNANKFNLSGVNNVEVNNIS